ncbi:hypothetical protein ACTXMG_05195 [Corynebacterium flavescens]|uniref:hypothetical protein n=1 Tax=Corynebacterium flavescens TaxID=28028 RepID=UPI003FCFAB95
MLPEIHTHKGLHYIIEKSIIQDKTFDVIYWEAGESLQHNYVASVNASPVGALDYARSTAIELAPIILEEIHHQRVACLNAQLEMLP